MNWKELLVSSNFNFAVVGDTHYVREMTDVS